MAIATDGHQRGQDDERRRRHDDVDKPLHRLFGRGQRRPLKLDRHRVADVAVGPLKELRKRAERHQRHGQGEHAQALGDRSK